MRIYSCHLFSLFGLRRLVGFHVCNVHLELIVSVFGPFVEGSVVAETANIVDTVEALDAIGDSVHLEDADAVRHRSYCVDLEV